MITLQAAEGENPAIEWNEANTDLYSQTQEAQNWVQTNILNTESINTDETVARAGDTDLTRIKSQSYTITGFNLVVDRTYRSNIDCSIQSAAYILTVV
jgi:hypothetical protein